ncbi:MAG: Uma2 family endonuclease, partial [Planctomycetota bacterium]
GEVFAAETGFRIASDPDTVRAADVAFISKDVLGAKITKGYWPGPPDLAVEVVSPHDTASALEVKVQDWLRAGAKQVWVADPSQATVSVYRLSDPLAVYKKSDALKAEDLLPGFSLKVADLFA